MADNALAVLEEVLPVLGPPCSVVEEACGGCAYEMQEAFDIVRRGLGVAVEGERGDERPVHLMLQPDLYEQIASLAQANRRTVTAELTLAVECYLEQAIRGSQRWHDLATGQEARR